jgi:hypothetical protein
MKNVTMTADKKTKTLTIVVDLSKQFGESKSGKNLTIASTEGNKSVGGDFEEVIVGLNVYKSK